MNYYQNHLLLWLAGLLLSVWLTAATVQAQSELPKVETSATLSVLNVDGSPPVLAGSTDLGVGGRLTINLNHRYSVEAEYNLFPQDRAQQGRRTQGLFGLKIGGRVSNAGAFLKFRPGFVHFSQAEPVPPLVGRGVFSKTNFALDLGGGFEFYTSRRGLVRFDFGDTMIRISNIRCPFLGCSSNDITHNFQFTVGLGVRF